MNFLEAFEFLKLFDQENLFNINYRECQKAYCFETYIVIFLITCL